MNRHVFVFLLFVLVSSLYAKGKFITYTVEGKKYEGYYAGNEQNSPLVILVHDWDGLTEYEVKRAEMLLVEGYSVFAVDLFGKNIRPTETKERRTLTGSLYNDRKKMRSLLNGGIKTAGEQGGNVKNTVIAGYCFGGAAVLELARSGAALKGFVSFHGGLETPEGQSYKNTKGNVLILHGTADTSITMDHFAGLAKELEENKIKHEMISYSGAPHAFTVFGSPRYREDSDKKSWKRFLEFLEEVL